ncbi:nuclear transport factor 2 family protein [Xenorhabdus sp. Sc-CR9]|uniref:nuclear transport factor 2 family protein n=1 Tax=Xenorhabdus sp. Sc-CR9 TaxID=2584468 RepID=UPI001F2044D6|nr:nuclear transport factor 2 family protein [Xenorhabdus sp. Sc-CR9]
MFEVVFDKYIEAVLEKSPEKLAFLFSEDGILKLPFRTSRDIIEGQSQILEHYSTSFGQAPLIFTSVQNIELYSTNNSDTFIVEYQLNGKTLPHRKDFYCLYINVFKLNNGKIKELHDYEDVLNREAIFS